MSRYRFGGGIGDFAVAPYDATNIVGGTGALFYATVPTLPVTCWSLPAGGVRYTDLLSGSQLAIQSVVTTNGQLPFVWGPDGVVAMWADGGGGTRSLLTPNNLGDLIQAAGGLGAPTSSPPVPTTVVSATTYTLQLSDVQTALRFVAQSQTTVSIPLDSAANPPSGAWYELVQGSPAPFVLSFDAGAIVRVKAGGTTPITSSGQWSVVYLKNEPEANTWLVTGDFL